VRKKGYGCTSGGNEEAPAESCAAQRAQPERLTVSLERKQSQILALSGLKLRAPSTSPNQVLMPKTPNSKSSDLRKDKLHFLKHSEKICSVCGGHLISINFPLTNWEGYYAYSSRMGSPYIHQFSSYKLGGISCLLLKDGKEIMPTCRCKNPPTIEE